MADENTLGGEGDNQQTPTVATEPKSPSESDIKKAEEFKETANGFFKSNTLYKLLLNTGNT